MYWAKKILEWTEEGAAESLRRGNNILYILIYTYIY